MQRHPLTTRIALPLLLAGCAGSAADQAVPAPAAAPASLQETGLYADWSGKVVAADNLAFAPRYPLWTDGATKRRWIHLPDGAAIDASRVDAWRFPVGTRLWKEFSFGRRVETRYMERIASGWIHATYAWNQDQTAATLAPASGLAGAAEIAPGAWHAIPGQTDCRACHDDARPVLGFSAVQLADDLDDLVARGLIRGLPDRFVAAPPRIAARSETERAALGYLHGNCGGCHNPDSAPAGIDMLLAYPLDPEPAVAPAIATTFDRPSGFALAGAAPGTTSLRIAPGDPDRSVLLARMRARDPITQMPPLGTVLVDRDAADLIERWITEAPGGSGRLATTTLTEHRGE